VNLISTPGNLKMNVGVKNRTNGIQELTQQKFIVASQINFVNADITYSFS
jgi:hypothetical protein